MLKYLNKFLELNLRRDESGYLHHSLFKRDVLFRVSSPQQLRDFRVLSGLLYGGVVVFIGLTVWLGNTEFSVGVVFLMWVIKYAPYLSRSEKPGEPRSAKNLSIFRSPLLSMSRV